MAPAPVLSSVEGLLADLAGIVGAGAVSARETDRTLYSRDMWPKTLLWTREGKFPYPPDAVVWPADEAQVVQVVRYAAERGIPIVPYGAGSGVAAGAMPVRGGISLDTKRLDTLEVDPDRRVLRAGAGVVGQRLEEWLQGRGLTMGHFPSSIYCSTVGGWVAARGAGQLSSRYGKIEDMVLGLRAVAGTGEVLAPGDAFGEGPDLVQLLTGSEGTLAVLTEGTFRVHPLPEHKAYRGVGFKSVEQGVAAMREIFRSGLRPDVMRLYDPPDTAMVSGHPSAELRAGSAGGDEGFLKRIKDVVMSTAAAHPALINRAAGLLGACRMVIGFEGRATVARADLEDALRIALGAGGEDGGEEPGLEWIRNRYAVSYKQAPLFAAGLFADTMEVATIWSNLLHLYHAVREAIGPHALVLAHFSHAYLEGCSIYFTFVGRGSETYDQAWNAAMTATVESGATLSHHHGVGLSKQAFMGRELGEGMALYRAIKRALDPKGIMNPGKMGLDLPEALS